MASKRQREAAELKRKKMARLRFRKIIRLVSLNSVWLLSDQADQKLSLNVKKNIALLVRPQRKVGLLSMSEKAILRQHPSFRTIEERKKLVTLLAGLPCFAKIPPKVCARLGPIINFTYVGEGKVIIREGDQPVFVYFILSGEVVVTKRIFDYQNSTYIEKMECLSGPGDCIGDIEVIEDCRRRNTYTAASIVEMLVLLEADFQRILYPVMATQWLDKKNALLALGYFKFFSEEQITNACKMSQIRQFEPLETIYYEDRGHISYVHFVISGECIILQCLKMKAIQKKGKKIFELVDISKDDGDNVFQDMTNDDLLKKLRADEKSKSGAQMAAAQAYNSDEDEEEQRIRRDSRATRLREVREVEISCGLRDPSYEELQTEALSKMNKQEEPQVGEAHEGEAHEGEAHEGQPERAASHDVTGEAAENANIVDDEIEIVRGIGPTTDGEQAEEQPNTETAMETTGEAAAAATVESAAALATDNADTPQTHAKVKDLERKYSQVNDAAGEPEDNAPNTRASGEPDRMQSTSSLHQSNRKSITIKSIDPRWSAVSEDRDSITTKPTSKSEEIKVENRFIDVGSLTFGGIFGLGEKIEHRVVMARTTVQCLMLPRFWLFAKDQNPGNIWQRRRFYLDTTIPSRQSLFADFLTTRKWQQFKNDLIESCVDQSQLSNPTKVQDVPIICRIVEANDD